MLKYNPLKQPHFNSITFLKTLIPKMVTFWGPGDYDWKIWVFEGDTIRPVTVWLLPWQNLESVGG